MTVHMARRAALINSMMVALAAACLAVLSPWAIPLGAVPVTLALLGVYLIGAVFGTWRGALAVAVYLALGAAGVPVFGGFTGGIGHFLSPTGGFLLGYLVCAAVIGISKRSRKTWLLPVMILIGTTMCYAVGVTWYCVVTGTSPLAACAVCVLPFLPADLLKAIGACALTPPLRRACARLSI